jgi:hypothetical protein
LQPIRSRPMTAPSSEALRLAYADPPYPGQAAKHYADHPDFAGEVDHAALLRKLDTEYDGWVLHTASTTLGYVLGLAAAEGIEGFRVMAWVKPFAAFKRNVSVAYAWEPVLIKPVRKPVVSGRIVMRDWISESITLRRSPRRSAGGRSRWPGRIRTTRSTTCSPAPVRWPGRGLSGGWMWPERRQSHEVIREACEGSRQRW